jgi:hemerythrin-like domain-containing protein
MSSKTPMFEEGPFTLIETPRFKTGKVSPPHYHSFFLPPTNTTPSQTDQYTQAATEMACVHNFIIRALSSIYHHALTVQPSQYHAFVSYAYHCHVVVHAHHNGEETFAFPAIESATGAKGVMEANVHQHEAFHDGLAALASYLESLLKHDVSQFSGARLREIMDGFAPALNQHLHDEIPTLLELEKFGDGLDLLGIMDKEGQMVMKSLSKTRVMPVALLNHDVDYEGGIHADFPPIPKPIRWVFMHILTLRHYSWWKFASCDFSGRLKAVKS